MITYNVQNKWKLTLRKKKKKNFNTKDDFKGKKALKTLMPFFL